MYNEELFQRLSEEFKDDSLMRTYCLMTSKMYNHLYENCSQATCDENDYQRQWWMNKYLELSNTNYQV